MKQHLIITISREYGSGGRQIGEALANRLKVPFYDRAIIDMTAKESGFAVEFIQAQEQRVTSSLLFNLATGGGYYAGQSLSDQIYFAERSVIQKLAQQGSCVIVGRCADYILRDDYDILSVFIHADPAIRTKRIVEEYGVKAQDGKKALDKTDKARARHYEYYGQGTWGDARNYHLSLDSGRFGIDRSVALLEQIVRELDGE